MLMPNCVRSRLVMGLIRSVTESGVITFSGGEGDGGGINFHFNLSGVGDNEYILGDTGAINVFATVQFSDCKVDIRHTTIAVPHVCIYDLRLRNEENCDTVVS